jgi:hypothetical protein
VFEGPMFWCARHDLAFVVAAADVLEIAGCAATDVDLAAIWGLGAVDLEPRALRLRRGQNVRVAARLRIVDAGELALQPLPALCAAHLAELGVTMLASREGSLGYVIDPGRLSP